MIVGVDWTSKINHVSFIAFSLSSSLPLLFSVCLSVCACVRVCVLTCVHVCKRVRTCVRTHPCVCAHACSHVRKYPSVLTRDSLRNLWQIGECSPRGSSRFHTSQHIWFTSVEDNRGIEDLVSKTGEKMEKKIFSRQDYLSEQSVHSFRNRIAR